MKRMLVASALLACMTPMAFAQSTTDVQVTGTIVPSACTPTLAGGGTFDFGTIAASDLNASTSTPFTSPPQQLSVVCNGPTRFALHGIDNRAGTSNATGTPTKFFGLGLNGAEKIGSYLLVMPRNSFSIDGSSSMAFLVSADKGSSWSAETNMNTVNLFNGSSPHVHGFGTNGATTPTAITRLQGDLQVGMSIAPANSLTLTDDVKIDGAATLNLVYL